MCSHLYDCPSLHDLRGELRAQSMETQTRGTLLNDVGQYQLLAGAGGAGTTLPGQGQLSLCVARQRSYGLRQCVHSQRTFSIFCSLVSTGEQIGGD